MEFDFEELDERLKDILKNKVYIENLRREHNAENNERP